MEKLAAEFRATVAREVGDRSRRGDCYRPHMRRLAVACARQGAARGMSPSSIAIGLGVHVDTLRKWLASTSPAARGVAMTSALVPVRVVREGSAAVLTLHGPCGVRVDGIKVNELAELLRALEC